MSVNPSQSWISPETSLFGSGGGGSNFPNGLVIGTGNPTTITPLPSASGVLLSEQLLVGQDISGCLQLIADQSGGALNYINSSNQQIPLIAILGSDVQLPFVQLMNQGTPIVGAQTLADGINMYAGVADLSGVSSLQVSISSFGIYKSTDYQVSLTYYGSNTPSVIPSYIVDDAQSFTIYGELDSRISWVTFGEGISGV